MTKPLVSVVVPVFNVERLLPRCLDSLLAQDHRPLEVIVVDDGSRDGSPEVLRRYAAAHPEVRAVLQEHRGLGPARNAALALATGEYVTMVDADDWIEPTFVSDTLRIARQTGSDVVISGFCFEAAGLRVRFPFLPRRSSFTGPEAAETSINMMRLPAFAWAKLYRRELFHADDEPFPAIFYEDLATTPRILRRARRVALTRTVHYHYCLRPDSIVGAFGVKNVFSFAAAIDILRHDLAENGLWESWQPAYRRLLRQARLMMPVQVLFQRNRIPLRARVPLLRRYAALLSELEHRPLDRHRTTPVRRARRASAPVRNSAP